MQHLTAIEHVDGGWHYGHQGKRGASPVGYCRDHAPHTTETLARECFSEWQRDHIRLDGRTSNWTDCRECKGPTKQYARVEGDGYSLVTLCPEHLTDELAAKHLGLNEPAGDRWYS